MLVECEDCGREISDRAGRCPHCGCPVTPRAGTVQADAVHHGTPPGPANETVIIADGPEPANKTGMWIAAVVLGLLILLTAGYLVASRMGPGAQPLEKGQSGVARFEAYRLTGTANVRERPSTSATVVAQARAGGSVRGDVIEEGGARWLRLSGGEFEGAFIWMGNLEGVAQTGDVASFAPPPAPESTATPTPEVEPAWRTQPLRPYLVGRWRAPSRSDVVAGTTCDYPQYAFYADGSAEGYEEAGRWSLSGERLVIDWEGNEMNDFEPLRLTFDVTRTGPDEMRLSGNGFGNGPHYRC